MAEIAENRFEYWVRPKDYLNRLSWCIESHNETQHRRFLFYAALELRFAIESVLSAYLRLLSRQQLSNKKLKLYRADDLKRAILTIDPLFLHKLDFVEMLSFYGESLFSGVVKPDLALLSEAYGKLGGYLHSQTNFANEKLENNFWPELEKIINSTTKHLTLVLERPFVSIKFTEKGNLLLTNYAEGKISKQDVIESLDKEWNLLFKEANLSFA